MSAEPLTSHAVAAAEIARLRGQVAALREAMADVRAAITNDNGLNGDSINCTIWCSDIETAVDRIDAALAATEEPGT